MVATSDSDQLAGFSAYITFTSVDDEKNRRRFYSLSWQYDLWGQLALVRAWGRVGHPGQSPALA